MFELFHDLYRITKFRAFCISKKFESLCWLSEVSFKFILGRDFVISAVFLSVFSRLRPNGLTDFHKCSLFLGREMYVYGYYNFLVLTPWKIKMSAASCSWAISQLRPTNWTVGLLYELGYCTLILELITK